VILLWQVVLGGKVLVPFDNLFAFPPWKSFAQQMGVGVPHNELLSDLLLENFAWKNFIVRSLADGQVPMWNPYLFCGVPFLAAGQHSALYPLSALFYILPVVRAYGLFTVLQLGLAGFFAYLFLRSLGAGRMGGAVGGLAYSLSGFMVTSINFPMVISAALWLPLALLTMEGIFRQARREDAPSPVSYLPWVLGGAVILGVHFLAGHPEISYLVLAVLCYYGLWNLASLALSGRRDWRLAHVAGSLILMAALGTGLGAIQLIPLYELVQLNFRQGSASYEQVVGWAYPVRQLVTFLVPDFFGNPSHHSYFDLLSWQSVPATRDFMGRPINTIFWGIKNYVEAGSYTGLIPLLLVPLAFAGRTRRRAWLFVVLAVVSLLLAFGTPLYALLYHGLPGVGQLHTPFRWVFPFTFSVAVLAGLGADSLARGRLGSLVEVIRYGALAAGGGLLLAMVGILLWPQRPAAWAQALVERSDLAQRAFADGAMFLSYQFPHFLKLGGAIAAAGLILTLRRRGWRIRGVALWKPLLALAVAAELLVLGMGFNPAADPALYDFVPPSIQFLQEDGELFRVTSYNADGEQTFQANAGMFYGISDVRGYDSIIPKGYAEYMGLIEIQGELIYNRIAPIYSASSLDSRLLDLANVKYVLSTQDILNDGYRLVYDEEILIYQNLDHLPRAFLVPRGEVIRNDDLRSRTLRSFEPAEFVILEEASHEATHLLGDDAPSAAVPGQVEVASYGINDVHLLVDSRADAFLVLTDSFFPGWKAYISSQDKEEAEARIYRADGNFRSVFVPAGQHQVHFRYTPMSFKLGLYFSFLAAVIVLLLLGLHLWRRFYSEGEQVSTLRRVTKNSLTPMTLSLINKAIDMAFAMLMLRILAPEGAGRYQFAVAFIGYFEILARFGLGTLLTREVAKDRSQANLYLNNTVVLRTFLLLGSLPLMAIAVLLYVVLSGLTPDVVAAIGLFAVALFISNISDAFSAMFNAHERMEHPAAIATVATVARVTLGAIVLLVGLGFVGLAGVSVAVNLLSASILFYLMRGTILRPKWGEIDLGFQRKMLGISYPLMINHLLATIFFRIDVLILQPLQGDAVVGWYGAAYKYIDGLNIIPAYFTMALFPLMSRYAEAARDNLIRTYVLSVRLLLTVSLPLAVAITFSARELILILGGAEYLPHSMIALQILIWAIPIGFINSVTQYALIAIDQQRFLTWAFIIGVAFNLAGNILLIPIYGYRAAAVITILSELVLLIPFYYCVRKNLSSIPWLDIFWRPSLAAAIMAAALWGLGLYIGLAALPIGIAIYAAALVFLGAFGPEEIEIIRRMIPLDRWRPQEEDVSNQVERS
jgi:O-antigen/teichoic acid export membrane protein